MSKWHVSHDIHVDWYDLDENGKPSVWCMRCYVCACHEADLAFEACGGYSDLVA